MKSSRHSRTRIAFSALMIFLLTASFVSANERRFAYTYETGTLPAGVKELEVWNTFRTGRDTFYSALDNNIEFEFGITDRLMGALYLKNKYAVSVDAKGVESSGFDLPAVAAEIKWKLLDPVADPLGLGLYFETTVSPKEIELEGKILLDKKFGPFLAAFNLVGEPGWEYSTTTGRTDFKFEFEGDLGLAFFFNTHFSLGLELRNHNEVASNKWQFSSLFLGPVLAFSMEHWWIALSFQPQLVDLLKSPAALQLDDHEKFETRLLVSFHF